MKKNKVTKLALISLLTLSACGQPNVSVSPNKTEKLTSININEGLISVKVENLQIKRSFGIKAVNFTSGISKLKLDVMGVGMTTVTDTKDIPANGNVGATFSLAVPAGKNRVLVLSALDAQGNTIAVLMGAIDVIAGQNNQGKINYFETSLASVIKHLMETNPSILNTLDINGLRASITSITGYDTTNFTFSKLDPSKLNYLAISSVITSSSTVIPETTSDLTKLTTVNVTTNQAGATVMVTDLNSSVGTSDNAFMSSIPNVQVGKFKVVVMKTGFLNKVVDVDTTGTAPFNITANLDADPSFPIVTSIDKSTAMAGETLILTGTNFDTVNPANNVVTFNFGNTPITVTGTSTNGTSLTVIVPSMSGQTADMLGNISIKIGTRMVANTPAFTLKLTDTNPTIGTFGVNETSTEITIGLTGTNFVTGMTAMIGTTPAKSVTVNSPTSATIVFDRPLSTATTDLIGKLTITVTGQTPAVSSNDLTVTKQVPPPIISSIETATFGTQTTTNNTLSIAGANLDGVNKIELQSASGNKLEGTISVGATATNLTATFNRPIFSDIDFVATKVVLLKDTNTIAQKDITATLSKQLAVLGLSRSSETSVNSNTIVQNGFNVKVYANNADFTNVSDVKFIFPDGTEKNSKTIQNKTTNSLEAQLDSYVDSASKPVPTTGGVKVKLIFTNGSTSISEAVFQYFVVAG